MYSRVVSAVVQITNSCSTRREPSYVTLYGELCRYWILRIWSKLVPCKLAHKSREELCFRTVISTRKQDAWFRVFNIRSPMIYIVPVRSFAASSLGWYRPILSWFPTFLSRLAQLWPEFCSIEDWAYDSIHIVLLSRILNKYSAFSFIHRCINSNSILIK